MFSIVSDISVRHRKRPTNLKTSDKNVRHKKGYHINDSPFYTVLFLDFLCVLIDRLISDLFNGIRERGHVIQQFLRIVGYF